MREISAADQPHALRCMEIWGGNRAAESAVSTPGLDVWVYSRPHAGAARGGDVHYVSLCGGGVTTRLLLADVAGHGVSVAKLAKSLRELMRKHINHKSQGRLMASLNREFGAAAESGRFATAVVATYLTAGRKLVVSNAGHPRPLRYDAASKAWSFLDGADDAAGPADLPFGVLEDTEYGRAELRPGVGDLVLFYTDALPETEDTAGRQLGEAGLLELVSSLDPSDAAGLPTAIVSRLDAFRGGPAAGDDLTMLLVRHAAGPPRRRSLVERLEVYAKVFALKPV